jgi:WhiB family redox-sensing transcriptional regulator
MSELRDHLDHLDAAICRQTDPELWFPEKGGSNEQARRLCRSCPFITPCLRYALDNREHWGVWGGTSERERRKMLRRSAEAA